MKTTEVENFPGFPWSIQGSDLMMRMQEQAERFGATVVYDDVLSLALEEATFLTRFADTVYLVNRRETLRGSHVMQQRAFADPKIHPVFSTEVSRTYGEDIVTGIGLRSTADGRETALDVSGIFVAIGAAPRTHLVHGQLDLTPEGTIAVQGRSSQTNIAGVFAAGDVVDPSYKQAVTAAASGTVAALDAEHYLASLPAELIERTSATAVGTSGFCQAEECFQLPCH